MKEAKPFTHKQAVILRKDKLQNVSLCEKCETIVYRIATAFL